MLRAPAMKLRNLSACGRFVVLDALYLDRMVLEALARWASEHGVRLQDAIQLAICAFNEGALDTGHATPPMAHASLCGRSSRASSTRPGE